MPPNDTSPTMEFAAQCIRNAYLLLPRPPVELIDPTLDKEGTKAILKWAADQVSKKTRSRSEIQIWNKIHTKISCIVTGSSLMLNFLIPCYIC